MERTINKITNKKVKRFLSDVHDIQAEIDEHPVFHASLF